MIVKVEPVWPDCVRVHFDNGTSTVVKDDGSFVAWTGESNGMAE